MVEPPIEELEETPQDPVHGVERPAQADQAAPDQAPPRATPAILPASTTRDAIDTPAQAWARAECPSRQVAQQASPAPRAQNAGNGLVRVPLALGLQEHRRQRRAQVSELNVEMIVDEAIVSANWRKNWPVIPVMKAHGTKTARQAPGPPR